MIKLNMNEKTLFTELTEDMLPITTKTDDTVFIYTIDDKFTYNCLAISENGECIESFNYESFDEMLSDAMESSLNKNELLCDLEITIK